MSQRAELRETWRAAMSAAGGAQRTSARERESPRAGLFRRTSGQHAPEAPATGYVIFFPGKDGYRVRDAAGPCPAVGEELDQDGRRYLVLKVGSSPFPNDLRPCAYLERCRPPEQLTLDHGRGRRATERKAGAPENRLKLVASEASQTLAVQLQTSVVPAAWQRPLGPNRQRRLLTGLPNSVHRERMTDPYTDPAERQPDLSHYVRVLKRRKWVIVGTTVLVAALAVFFSVRQTKVYQASAQVLINRQDLAAAVTGRTVNASLSEDPARFAATQAAIARGSAVAQLAVKNARVPNRTAAGLLASSTVTSNPSADTLIFTVDDADARDAATLVNAYAAAYAAYKSQLDTTSLQKARDELASQIATLLINGDKRSVLYTTLVSSEQQLHTMQLLQSQDTVLTHPTLGGQVKPTPTRNGILGLGFGLLLAVAFVSVLEALDKRVRFEEDIERKLGLPLLGRLAEPPRRLREKQRLTMINAPTSPQADAVRRLATNIEFSNPDHPSQVLMITSALDREGKSTTAANLAVALARAGRTVALVDLDLRQPSIASLFDVRELAGLTNVVMRQSTLDEALVPIRLPGSEPATNVSVAGSSLPGRLSVLPTGPLPANPGEFVAAKALVTRVLEPLQKRFDYVIVDAPPMCVGGDAAILSGKVDSLVVVARLGVIDRPALADLRRQLSAIPKPAIGFVVTGVDTPGGAYGYGTYSTNGEEPRSELRPPTDEDTAVEPRRARS